MEASASASPDTAQGSSHRSSHMERGVLLFTPNRSAHTANFPLFFHKKCIVFQNAFLKIFQGEIK